MSETLKIYASDSYAYNSGAGVSGRKSATESQCMWLKFDGGLEKMETLNGKRISVAYLHLYRNTSISVDKSVDYKIKVFDRGIDFDAENLTDLEAEGLDTVSVSLDHTGSDYIYGDQKYDDFHVTREAGKLREFLGSNAIAIALETERYTYDTFYGSNPPFVEITYADAEPSTILSINGREYYGDIDYLASEVDLKISWSSWSFANSYIWGEAPTITEQKIIWRAEGASDLTETVLELNALSYTVPAGTLKPGTNELGLKVTTSAGATFTKSYEFKVGSPKFSSMSPAGGVAPKNSPTLLTWEFTQTSETELTNKYGIAILTDIPIQQSSATVTYRTTGTTSTTSISITDGTTSYTIPAGTFTADSIDWMVTITTPGGLSLTSDWATVSTVDVASSSKITFPSGTSIDATITNRFSWQHIISTGTAQTAADLQYSTDGSTWADLASVTGSNQFYDVPAGTFSAGAKFWRVRTYNSDSVAGEWSTAAQFVAIASPSTPAITVQSLTGRPSITWETSEQQAYQVKLSTGYEPGTTYGTTQAWTAPYYLADGTYTVSIRVQNEYGLWSEWGTAALPVTHTAGDAITLTVTAENAAAALTWTTSGSYDFYIVERNGDPISKTTGKTYTDALATGETTYRIVGGYDADANYTASDEVTETIKPGTNYLYVIATGEWIEMRTSETQLRQNTATRSVGLTTVHLAGLSYPVEELSGTADMTLTVTVAWPHGEAAKAKALEAAVGKLVCLKDTFGNQVIGTLATLECTYDKTMLRYAFTIQHTDYSEAVTL